MYWKTCHCLIMLILFLNSAKERMIGIFSLCRTVLMQTLVLWCSRTDIISNTDLNDKLGLKKAIVKSSIPSNGIPIVSIRDKIDLVFDSLNSVMREMPTVSRLIVYPMLYNSSTRSSIKGYNKGSPPLTETFLTLSHSYSNRR